MFGRLSLRSKLVVMMASLLAAVVVFLMVYFPKRMEASARRSLERRAGGMAVLLAGATAPGVEFDDASSVQEQIANVRSTPGNRGVGSSIGCPHTTPLPAPRDVYVYFDNDAKVRAPVGAQALRRRLAPS